MKLNIHQHLVGLALLSFAGFCVFGVFALHTLSDSKIGGSAYERIVRGKDMVADAMPSPGYLGGSYLTVFAMLEESDPVALRASIEAAHRARQEFENHYVDWEKDPPGGSGVMPALERAHRAGEEFFRVRDDQFIPALLAGNKAQARTLANGSLRQLFDQHRDAVVAACRI